MNPVLFHLWGPLSIHIYGVCIAIGGLIAFYLFTQDKKIASIVPDSTLINIFQIILLAGFFGGRIGLMLSQPELIEDPLYLFKFWEPGLSILGATICVAISLTGYLYSKKIPFLLLLDRIALYAPIAQSFGRLGCFFAGCCYGMPTQSWFSITYNHPNNLAPLHCPLHPAQLYSSFLLFCIFILLFCMQKYKQQPIGILFFSYLILMSIERFLIDFIRWDRVFTANSLFLSLLSIHQWIAIGICSVATISIYLIYKRNG